MSHHDCFIFSQHVFLSDFTTLQLLEDEYLHF